MGFLSRLLVPRGVRRAAHPVRTVKSAVTPRPIKQIRRALSPVDATKYGIERRVATSIRGGKRVKRKGYMHGSCQVAHRTPEAAANCRNR